MASKWFDLANEKIDSRRDKALYGEVETFCQHQLDTIQECIQQLREAIFFRGRLVSDTYYETAKNSLYTEQETTVNPRVRWDANNGTPHFYWEKTLRRVFAIGRSEPVTKSVGKGRSYVAYVRCKGAKSKQRMRVVLASKYIRLNARTQSISMTAFKDEPAWAKVTGELTEQKLTVLRKQAKLLADISASVARYRRLETKEKN